MYCNIVWMFGYIYALYTTDGGGLHYELPVCKSFDSEDSIQVDIT